MPSSKNNDMSYLDDFFGVAEKVEHKWERAPFTMVGAKSQSLKHIIPLIPINRNSIWVDHFCGTGVVSFNLLKYGKVNVINDRYSAITDFFTSVRDHCERLCEYLDQFPWNSRQQWNESRGLWNTYDDPVIRAAHWYYYWRGSVLGKGQSFGRGITSPFNPYRDVISLLPIIKSKLANFLIENRDARTLFDEFDKPETIHYLDPPYTGTDQGTYKHKWGYRDMDDLLDRIATARGTVLLSHVPCDQINKRDFWDERNAFDVVYTADVKTMEGNYKTDKPGNIKQKEMLWLKYAK